MLPPIPREQQQLYGAVIEGALRCRPQLLSAVQKSIATQPLTSGYAAPLN